MNLLLPFLSLLSSLGIASFASRSANDGSEPEGTGTRISQVGDDLSDEDTPGKGGGETPSDTPEAPTADATPDEPEEVTSRTPETPSMPEAAPETPDTAPSTPETTSDEPEAAPSTPEVVADAPDAPEETPSEPEVEPNTPETVTDETIGVAASVLLVDTRTDTTVLELNDGTEISSDFIGDPNLSIIVAPIGDAELGSVAFSLENGTVTRIENFEPLALFGDANGGDILAPEDGPMFPEAGTFSLQVDIFEGPDGTGALLDSRTVSITLPEPVTAPVPPVEEDVEIVTDVEDPVEEETEVPVETPAEDPVEEPVEAETPAEEPVEEEPTEEPDPVAEVPIPDAPEVPDTGEADDEMPGIAASVLLIDTRTDTTVLELTDGTEISGEIAGSPHLSVIVVPTEGTEIGSVSFDFNDGGALRTENAAPYALFGDAEGSDILASSNGPMFNEEGTVSLKIDIYEGPNGTGALLDSRPISLSVQEPIVVEEPEPAPEPETGTAIGGSVADPDPTPPSGNGGGDNENDGDTVNASGTVSVIGGRVTTLKPIGDDVLSVRILDGVDHGNVTVNPDNTMALVMTQSDFTGSQRFSYEVTHSDGSTSSHSVGLRVTEGPQADGWGTGENHYMLETDENDRVIVEHGDEHRKVYVSESRDALSIADIASREGMNQNQITGNWLANSDYGSTESLALDQTAGMRLWDTITPQGSETSNWLLLERGYEYGRLGEDFLNRDASGESELNPLYLGAWGEGDLPEVTARFEMHMNNTEIVIQDIHFSGRFYYAKGGNLILDHVKIDDKGMVVQNSDSVTIRNAQVIDAAWDNSLNGGDWDPHSDRIMGIYSDRMEGLLVENLFLDHNGWEADYREDGSGSAGQAPSMFSHNIYFGENISDLTIRDTISMRGASYGFNIRSGGFYEDLVALDNNAGFNFVGGNHDGAGFNGSYTLLSDTVTTSGAHKEVDNLNGALTRGINDGGQLSSMVDNIVAHLADPNNPSELADKTFTSPSIRSESDPHYDDTIVYNWKGSSGNTNGFVTEQNTQGLNDNVLDQTTIQNFTAQLLGRDNATIEDLANYLRAQSDGKFDDVVDADLIIAFFQTGFGIAPDLRETETTLRFVPNELGEGVRWDNRLNWDTDDLPGTQDGDSVDLGGNDVVFGTNATIDTLDFGNDGSLNVYGGKLTATGGVVGDAGGDLNLEGTGQAWLGGSDGSDLDILLTGDSRFANTGNMSGADLTVSSGQAILATDDASYEVLNGHKLTLDGSDVEVGFDDASGGIALLELEEGGTLEFIADGGGLAEISEFRSGSYGDAPNVQSGVDLGGGTLSLDLSGMSGTPGNTTLISSDELIGAFGDVDISGLGGRNATVVVNHNTDTVSLQLSSGGGNVSVETIGAEGNFDSGNALWQALTSGNGVFSDTNSNPTPDDELNDSMAA